MVTYSMHKRQNKNDEKSKHPHAFGSFKIMNNKLLIL